MKKIIYLLVGIVLFGGLYYSCAPEELPGSIYGTVVDKATGEPIKAAGVELSPSGLKTVTGSEGQFEFTELDPGKYTLIITKTGYVDGVSGTIEVKPGQQAKGDVQIEKLPPALKVVDDNREEISILDFGSAEDDVARSFSIFNDGTESLEWELTATADWIKSVSKTTGALSAGATQAIIITIDRAKLSSGENKTTVHITSNSGSKQLIVTATNNYQPTTLNTLPATDIKSNYAVLHGEILTEGTPKYTERGFVYSETSKPTIGNCIQQLTTPLTDEKVFTIEVTGLIEGKTYYVRAYAINGGKAAYSSNEVSFTPKGTSLPKVATKSITDIQRAEGKATILGEIQELGDPTYTERGFVYGKNHNPIVQTATRAIVEGNGIGEFVATLSNLQLGNIYYVRAYALNTVGVAYGEEQTLDFNPILPEVATNDVTGISEETKSATFHATITNAGDPVYIERGFVYGKSPDPTTGGATKLVVAGSGTGTYYGDVHNLELDCAYYVRAYVTYSLGTVYGENKMFSIKKTYPPTVTTSVVTQITTTTAVAGGNVTDDGGNSVTERGVVYSTNQNPTVADTKVVSGSGLGDFICNLTNLQEGTTYYVRAYAVNAKGTAYGEEVSFTTKERYYENGYEYIDLGLSVKWATMNVGASKAEDYGGYYAWGETVTKNTYDWSTYKYCNGSYNTLTKYNIDSRYGTVDNKTQLELSDDAARANWGGSWRMPTDAEMTELRTECTWTWTTQNGVKGYKVTSKKSGYTNNSIFLPAAGCRYDSSLDDAGSNGDYWSSSLATDYPRHACHVGFTSSYGGKFTYNRFCGFSVRPVCP